jgi:3-dehydroquinate synthase
MNVVDVTAEHRYSVLVGCSWQEELSRAMNERTRVAIVFSSVMRSHIGSMDVPGTEIHLMEVPDGEVGKDAKTLESLWNQLGEAGFTRSDLVVAIGGGATTDIGGFAAATWLRGIDWIAIPTSLAGMVDAAIGGKTGLNTAFGKNLAGAFHSPIEVLIDTTWLETLSDRDFAAGLAEVVKCGFIADREILTLLSGKNLSEIRRSNRLTEELILRSIKIKADVVGEDFHEGFAREVLNYGHTMGHAVELHSKYALRHGEAVSIGLVFVAELAHLKGILSEELVSLHRSLLSRLGLPTTYPAKAWDELEPILSLDKKARGKSLRFVAISGIGSTLRLEGVAQSDIAKAYERVSS